MCCNFTFDSFDTSLCFFPSFPILSLSIRLAGFITTVHKTISAEIQNLLEIVAFFQIRLIQFPENLDFHLPQNFKKKINIAGGDYGTLCNCTNIAWEGGKRREKKRMREDYYLLVCQSFLMTITFQTADRRS